MLRLAALFVAFVVVTVIGVGWIFDQIYSSITPAKTNDEFSIYQDLIRNVASSLKTDENLDQHIQNWNQQGQFKLELIDAETLLIPTELSNTFYTGDPLLLEMKMGLTLYIYLPDHNRILGLSHPELSYKNNNDLERNYWKLIFNLTFYGIIIAIILIWMYPLITRLIILRKAAIRFGEGNLDSRINLAGLSYIGDIEKEFNRMANRIQGLVGDNKLLSRAVSHELKTPIARLRFGLEMLAEAKDETAQKKYFERLGEDLDEMQSLVEELLSYARLGESSISLKTKTIDLNDIIQSIVSPYKHSEITLLNGTEESLPKIVGDPFYITILLSSIIKNAAKYADKTVKISSFTKSENLYIIIEDDGIGIPENERNEVMRPFFRGEKSIKLGSHGMGLAIAQRIAKWHEANIQISDSNLGGAKFTIEFKT